MAINETSKLMLKLKTNQSASFRGGTKYLVKKKRNFVMGRRTLYSKKGNTIAIYSLSRLLKRF